MADRSPSCVGDREAGQSELRLIPPLGSTGPQIGRDLVRGGAYGVNPPYLAWCPDGSCLVATDSPGEGKPDALFVISSRPAREGS